MDEAIGHYPPDQKRSAALPLLHLWQEHFGLINDDAVTWIATKLGLQPINILELVTFYPMLREKRPGEKHIGVCPSVCLASGGPPPVCMVNDDLHENVQPDNAVSILSQPAERPAVHPPHPLEHRIIFKNIGRRNWKTDIKTYLDEGGYEDLRKAVKISRTDIVNEVKTSGLRGRGGAGFPCGVKWSFIKPDEKKPVYLICNADESEPGTFKDRYIIHEDPHQLLEGIAISCFALNARTAYIYIRGNSPKAPRSSRAQSKKRGSINFSAKTFSAPGSMSMFTFTAGPVRTFAAKKPA